MFDNNACTQKSFVFKVEAPSHSFAGFYGAPAAEVGSGMPAGGCPQPNKKI
jgi:hypothetical protein